MSKPSRVDSVEEIFEQAQEILDEFIELFEKECFVNTGIGELATQIIKCFEAQKPSWTQRFNQGGQTEKNLVQVEVMLFVLDQTRPKVFYNKAVIVARQIKSGLLKIKADFKKKSSPAN